MKTYIRILAATLLLLGACKTQKPIIKDDVTYAPSETVLPKADTVVYNYPPPRNYSVPKKIFKELENFETAFDELKAMLEGTKEPNFERAIFLSENPYHGNKYTYQQFQEIIDVHLYFINQVIRVNDKSDSIDFNVKVNQYGRFNMDEIRHLPDEKKALYKKAIANWSIFTYITDTVNIYPFYHKPFSYATHDPFGIKDWSNSQVINLLYSQEQKGNCFALTALFKILSDRLQSDARICTAPQHIYIQHKDKKGDYYNVELATAGHPGDGTIQTLTHTTTEGIKSGIALRSYDSKQSIGICLVNLAKSYEHKFGSKDDDFMLKCAELVLKHDRLNLNALLLKQQILDARVTNFAKENNINDINKLKSNNEISQSIYELENHLALLYRLGYRQMPFDMQEIIMTGVIPENFEDKNPKPFTSFEPEDEHRKKFTTLYGGLFQEVFVIREYEPYGHFTFQTSTNKITVIDTTAQTGFLIDPVAFAYDFGARMYDARLGMFTSVDPKFNVFPSRSPYSAFMNNPIFWDDPDGQCPICPWLDAVVDIGFALYDIGEITYDYVTKGKVDPVSVAALTADLGAIFIPMTTGAGLAVRAGVTTTKGAVKTTTKIVIEKAKDVAIKNADDINKTFTKAGKYAPYKAGTKVADFTTETSEQFVRMYKKGENNPAGQWMMKKSDLLDDKGKMLSPEKIKDKFSLEYVPDRMVDVNVPANTKMRMGEAAGVDKLGTKGGGTQFQLLDQIPSNSFTNSRPIQP
jgi:RHS repeat-associated protein